MLHEALSELKAEVERIGFSAGLLAEIAADHALNPALVARKFAEQYGVAPEAYVVTPAMAAAREETAKRAHLIKIETTLAAVRDRKRSLPHHQVVDLMEAANALRGTDYWTFKAQPRRTPRRAYRDLSTSELLGLINRLFGALDAIDGGAKADHALERAVLGAVNAVTRGI